MQRVGSKGPAADLTRALVARLTPSLLPPEVLHGAMEAAEGSQEAQRLLVEVASAAPYLLAQVRSGVCGCVAPGGWPCWGQSRLRTAAAESGAALSPPLLPHLALLSPTPPPSTHCPPQSLDRVAELFDADDPLLAECGARMLAGAGRHMLAHRRAVKQEVPREVRPAPAGPRLAGRAWAAGACLLHAPATRHLPGELLATLRLCRLPSQPHRPPAHRPAG